MATLSANPAVVEPIVWPSTTQYKRALLQPERAFADPELRTARFDRDAMGTPASVEGQSAVVFFGETDSARITVRCLKRPVAYGERRYAALQGFLADWPQSPLTTVEWQSSGIAVEGRRWPIVRMDRVEGLSLRQHVARTLAEDSGDLQALSARWLDLAQDLHHHRVAHGDLQQDNVRVVRNGDLRLIDLDAVWAPPLISMPPKECGHRHFQHPERLRTGHWDETVDTFSALVIYVSLRALAADPTLWDSYHNDENLVFTDADFERPGETAIWTCLAASRDLEVRDLGSLLAQFCHQTVQVDVDLMTILSTRTLPGGAVYVLSGEPLTRAWWPDTLGGTGSTVPAADPTSAWDAPPDHTDDWAATAGGGSPAGPAGTAPGTIVDSWPYQDLGDGTAKAPAPTGPPTPAPRTAEYDRRRLLVIAAILLTLLLVIIIL